jgi:hypothetical protein
MIINIWDNQKLLFTANHKLQSAGNVTKSKLWFLQTFFKKKTLRAKKIVEMKLPYLILSCKTDGKPKKKKTIIIRKH